jgi:hypothetical protein
LYQKKKSIYCRYFGQCHKICIIGVRTPDQKSYIVCVKKNVRTILSLYYICRIRVQTPTFHLFILREKSSAIKLLAKNIYGIFFFWKANILLLKIRSLQLKNLHDTCRCSYDEANCKASKIAVLEQTTKDMLFSTQVSFDSIHIGGVSLASNRIRWSITIS